MSRRTEGGLRTLILAIHEEATITATAKGMTGALAQLAALQETASLASGQAGRTVGEEEVMRILLHARRTRRLRAEAETARRTAMTTVESEPTSAAASAERVPVRVRRRRIAPLALRSLTRTLAATVR